MGRDPFLPALGGHAGQVLRRAGPALGRVPVAGLCLLALVGLVVWALSR